MIRKYEGKQGVRYHVLVYAGAGRKRSGGSFATLKAARRAEALLRLAGRPPGANDPFDMRLGTHLEDLEKQVGRRTLAGYESIARNYLKPYFKV